MKVLVHSQRVVQDRIINKSVMSSIFLCMHQTRVSLSKYLWTCHAPRHAQMAALESEERAIRNSTGGHVYLETGGFLYSRTHFSEHPS